MRNIFYKTKKKRFILVLIIILGLIMRLIYYISINKNIILVSDSATYINCAKAMQKGFYIDLYRPPVYPFIIMLSALIFSWEKYFVGVIAFQLIFSIISTILIYKIALIISEKEYLGLITALVINLSISVYGWDFMIMTESLSILLVTLIAYLFIKYFQTVKFTYMAAAFLIMILAIFTKPFFIFLPLLFCIIYILRRIKVHDIRLRWHTAWLVLCVAVTYLFVLTYSIINYKENNFFGITSVSNVNLFGKVLQYHLEDSGTDSKIISDVKAAYINTPSEQLVRNDYLEPWNFIGKYNWNKDSYKDIGRFSSYVIRKNLVKYTFLSIQLTANIAVNINPFKDYIAIMQINNKGLPSKIISFTSILPGNIGKMYYLIPIALIISIILVIFSKSFIEDKYFNITIISSLIFYHYIVSAFFSYGDYSRLLAPSYPLLYFVIIYYLISIFLTIKKVFMNKIKKPAFS